MDSNHFPPVDAHVLGGSMRDFGNPTGPDLLARTQPFLDWQDARRTRLLWSYSKSTDDAPLVTCRVRYDSGEGFSGINLASQDYLSLSTHPAILNAAREAMNAHGVHSAGSPVLLGNTAISVQLEERLCDFLQMEQCILFPTGWAAGFSLARGLVRNDDHVVMDKLAHASLQEGACAATRNVHLVDHADTAAFERALAEIRASDTTHAILVIVESLYSMDSDTPDIGTLQALCKEFRATLAVDVAHDLGAMGDRGHGHIGNQGMLGKVDLVMGSFSKTFASNGGFVLTHSRAVKEYLKFFASPHIFSNALSPVQAAVVSAALSIVRSPEGSRRRQQLLLRVEQLRRALANQGFACLGDASAIVPVHVGDEGLTRLLTRALPAHGVIANCVEYAGVAKGAARLRLQVMSEHTEEQISRVAKGISAALADAFSCLRD